MKQPAPSVFLILNLSKDEDAPRTIRRCERFWNPAFAGKTEMRKQDTLQRYFPPMGEVPGKPG